MGKILWSKFKESAVAVLPVAALVVLLAAILTDIDANIIWLYLIGMVLLIVGMAIFSMGVDIAMMPMGKGVGTLLGKTKKRWLWLVIAVAIIMGFVITIAEPSLLTLAAQLGQGKVNVVLLCAVAGGVGIMVATAVLRAALKIKLTYIIFGFYLLVFILGGILYKINPSFIALAFDSGGVTTGPITVPFIMAIGLGLASVKSAKDSEEASFGTVGLSVIGPILAILILGLSGFDSISPPDMPDLHYKNWGEIVSSFGDGTLNYLLEVFIALSPIVLVFFVFQVLALRFPKNQIIKIVIGILYTYLGLTIFLTGINVGFQPMGYLLGNNLASMEYNFLLIPLGMAMGCLVVLAEPTVHVLVKQVEEITAGTISRRMMLTFLAIGVTFSVGFAMLRVLTGIPIWFFIIPVYAAILTLMFFVPPIFSGLSFDSGSVASGAIAATFMLPMAIGASHAVGGDIFLDAYGLVAFISMTPILMVQIMGMIFKIKTKRLQKQVSPASIELPLEFDHLDTIEFSESENITLVDNHEYIQEDGGSGQNDILQDFDTQIENENSQPNNLDTQSENENSLPSDSQEEN